MTEKLVLLGVGKTALAVKRASGRYRSVAGSTRSVEKLPGLEEAGIEPFLIEYAGEELRIADQLVEKFEGADVLVSFPPDKLADSRLSELAYSARAIVYISSTGVYGGLSGRIDEGCAADARGGAARLEAEDVWRRRGAVVLRVAGLYDKSSGLHVRLKSGTYRIPGDGSNYVSRIHLDDLAKIILACFEKAAPGSTYVVADSRPATHMEIAQWLCERMDLPIPDMVPLDTVHETMRGNRQIIAEKVLRDLDVRLRYPSFVEGYGTILAEIG